MPSFADSTPPPWNELDAFRETIGFHGLLHLLGDDGAEFMAVFTHAKLESLDPIVEEIAHACHCLGRGVLWSGRGMVGEAPRSCRTNVPASAPEFLWRSPSPADRSGVDCTLPSGTRQGYTSNRTRRSAMSPPAITGVIQPDELANRVEFLLL
jgi:hypothetical protein